MKTTEKKLLSCSVIALFPVLLVGSFVWMMMWHSIGLRQGETCAQTFQPFRKGLYWNNDEWHHYVDFRVNVTNPREYRWRITEAPLPSAILRGFSGVNILRVSYRWPDDWKDPYQLERWEVCLLES